MGGMGGSVCTPSIWPSLISLSSYELSQAVKLWCVTSSLYRSKPILTNKMKCIFEKWKGFFLTPRYISFLCTADRWCKSSSAFSSILSSQWFASEHKPLITRWRPWVLMSLQSLKMSVRHYLFIPSYEMRVVIICGGGASLFYQRALQE